MAFDWVDGAIVKAWKVLRVCLWSLFVWGMGDVQELRREAATKGNFLICCGEVSDLG